MINTLEVDSVILEFGSRRILQDVYLKSETGKICGLLGNNGAGKSCLMKIIFGELNTNNKSVRLNGETYINNKRSTDDLRYLPQYKFIPKSLSIKRIFEDFELDFMDFINEFPSFRRKFKKKFRELSGGEQRIIEIYLMLVSKSKFCMLDEPFSHVMPVYIETIKRLIVREKEKKGIIVTDHLYQNIIDISDSLYVISDGKTYLTKSVQDLETLGYININGY
ncbi:MAG: ATP-binding cassette domain-containing protein [Bacteroidales bacterium]|nr:ATP-binding cassette domain-containing protein [Bacteroidales bacterium]MDD3906947.1 ATP-binding cassette domain-containing protein [Bacteroidales bacterium]MDD4711802.1 ATP-binding cassette domain-containing protein [Bacteroidales bacterium]